MRKINVLAWDDKPEYLRNLAENIERFGIFIEVEEDEADFMNRFDNESWDFIILDVLDERISGEPRTTGIDLAKNIREINSQIFILFVTDDPRAIAQARAIPGPTQIRTKNALMGSLTNDIRNFIKLYVPDYSRVFLIFGHDRKAGGIRADLIKALEDHKLHVDYLTPNEGTQMISNTLVEKMVQCGGFIALCTPDDKVNEEYYQPRQNVLVEIGIVLGLNRDLKRLIILQRTGNIAEETANLPSDLHGHLTITFRDDRNYQDAIENVIKALRQRGLKIKDK